MASAHYSNNHGDDGISSSILLRIRESFFIIRYVTTLTILREPNFETGCICYDRLTTWNYESEINMCTSIYGAAYAAPHTYAVRLHDSNDDV